MTYIHPDLAYLAEGADDPRAAALALLFNDAAATEIYTAEQAAEMVAKLIAHAPTREQCIDQLAAAVDRTVLLGLQSNRAFLGRLLRHESFRAGLDVSTAFIERHFGAAEARQKAVEAKY